MYAALENWCCILATIWAAGEQPGDQQSMTLPSCKPSLFKRTVCMDCTNWGAEIKGSCTWLLLITIRSLRDRRMPMWLMRGAAQTADRPLCQVITWALVTLWCPGNEEDCKDFLVYLCFFFMFFFFQLVLSPVTKFSLQALQGRAFILFVL